MVKNRIIMHLPESGRDEHSCQNANIRGPLNQAAKAASRVAHSVRYKKADDLGHKSQLLT